MPATLHLFWCILFQPLLPQAKQAVLAKPQVVFADVVMLWPAQLFLCTFVMQTEPYLDIIPKPLLINTQNLSYKFDTLNLDSLAGQGAWMLLSYGNITYLLGSEEAG